MAFLSIVIGILLLAAIIASAVLWVLSIYHAATSKSEEIKNSRAIWLILIVFTGVIGSVVYFFVDKKKALGIWTIVAGVAIPLLLAVYAIVLFVVGAIYGAQEVGEMTESWTAEDWENIMQSLEEQGIPLDIQIDEQEMGEMLMQIQESAPEEVSQ